MRDRFRVIIANEAQADLRRIEAFHARVSVDHPIKVIKQILDAASSLQRLPLRFKQVRLSRKRAAIIHALTVAPYIVYYTVDDVSKSVNVLRIKHGRQRRTRRFP